MGLQHYMSDVDFDDWFGIFNDKIGNVVDYVDIFHLSDELLNLKKMFYEKIDINLEEISGKLRKLSMKIRKKHIELKEEINERRTKENKRRQEEDERRQIEDEIDLFILKKDFEIKYLISYKEFV